MSMANSYCGLLVILIPPVKDEAHVSSLRAFVSPSNWCLTRIFDVFCHIVTLKGLEVTALILLLSKLYSPLHCR